MIDRETAVSLASAFLRENADGAEPLSVRAEEDGWIISARAENGDTLLVYLDIEDAVPKFYSEEVVDVDLQAPRG